MVNLVTLKVINHKYKMFLATVYQYYNKTVV